MTFLPDLNTYLHQSSLLIQAYPTTRITTKYSLPRRPNPNSTSKRSLKKATALESSTSQAAGAPPPTTSTATLTTGKEKREPAATLTLKTFHAETGICLKYRTDKAQEVGRLLNGLGRLAKGEVIEMPSASGAAVAASGASADDKMDVDGVDVVKEGSGVTKTAADMTQSNQQQSGSGGGGGGGKKKKKGGKK